jgi:hypothetical protein
MWVAASTQCSEHRRDDIASRWCLNYKSVSPGSIMQTTLLRIAHQNGNTQLGIVLQQRPSSKG